MYMKWSVVSAVVVTTIWTCLINFTSATIPELAQSGRTEFPDNLVGLTLVEFYSPNCYHCRHYAPTVLRLSRYLQRRLTTTTRSGRLAFYYRRGSMAKEPVRVEQFSCKGGRWCRRLKLQVLPSLRLYRNHLMISELRGRKRYEKAKSWLQQALKMAQAVGWSDEETDDSSEEDEDVDDDISKSTSDDDDTVEDLERTNDYAISGDIFQTVSILPYSTKFTPTATTTMATMIMAGTPRPMASNTLLTNSPRSPTPIPTPTPLTNGRVMTIKPGTSRNETPRNTPTPITNVSSPARTPRTVATVHFSSTATPTRATIITQTPTPTTTLAAVMTKTPRPTPTPIPTKSNPRPPHP